jgi:hypothetical protein
MRKAVLVSLVSVFLAAPAAAAPRGFLELAGGIAQPLADDDYADLVDTSFKLALRGGAWLSAERATRFGVEIGADYTFGNFDSPNVEGRRLRLTGGLRSLIAVGPRVALAVRLAGGIDYASYEADFIFEVDGSDLGFTIELGGGLLFQVAPNVNVGAHVAVPVGFHSAEDEGIDFTSVDLDVLFAVGFGF